MGRGGGRGGPTEVDLVVVVVADPSALQNQRSC